MGSGTLVLCACAADAAEGLTPRAPDRLPPADGDSAAAHHSPATSMEPSMATAYRYTLFQRLLHWLIALLVIGLLAVGFTFWTLGYEGTVETFGQAMTNTLYTYHKTFGVLLLALMVLRLVLRRVTPPPAYQKPLTGFEKIAAGGVHLLLYGLLLAIPIGGWLATAAGGYPVEFFAWELPGFIGKNEALSAQLFMVHGYAGLVVALLLVLHIGAGLKHWKQKDGVMRRISLP
jgi:cytochrome b561